MNLCSYRKIPLDKFDLDNMKNIGKHENINVEILSRESTDERR